MTVGHAAIIAANGIAFIIADDDVAAIAIVIIAAAAVEFLRVKFAK